jgi:hypothetical protein
MTCPAPENPLAMRLDELGHYWLDLGGCCGRTSRYPLRLMAERVGGPRLLGDVLPRLRCEACGKKPARVLLLDRGDDSSHGARAAVKIDLSG